MAQRRSGTFQWVYTCNGSTSPPDAYQLRIGTASGVYSVCSCYSSSTFTANVRDLLTTPGTYYCKVIGSASGTTVACSTESTVTIDGALVRVKGA